jgi:hypothetical protein
MLDFVISPSTCRIKAQATMQVIINSCRIIKLNLETLINEKNKPFLDMICIEKTFLFSTCRLHRRTTRYRRFGRLLFGGESWSCDALNV